MTDYKPPHPRLHMVTGCGHEKRTIFSTDGGKTIWAGCFRGTPDKLKEAISEKYGSDDKLYKYVDDYLADVDRCARGWEPGSDEFNELVTSRFMIDRVLVARQGHALDQLINDKSEIVRMEVVKHEYGLDKLANDESLWIRGGVRARLEKQELEKPVVFGVDFADPNTMVFIRQEDSHD